MPSSQLTRIDYAAALALLARLEPLVHAPAFEQAMAREVGAFAAAEWSMLSLHGVESGSRRLAALPERRHVLRMDLGVGGARFVHLLLIRGGGGFSERDRQRFELLRPHLAFMYGEALRRRRVDGATSAPKPIGTCSPQPLTPRQGEVIRWLAHGKTDAEIADMLDCSPRTVQKHLEHIYAKLGVETRTAAVMRALQIRPPEGMAAPSVPRPDAR